MSLEKKESFLSSSLAGVSNSATLPVNKNVFKAFIQ